jgi:hypothetical protein
MPEYQVTCTTKSGGQYHEHITHIGGTAGGGWRLTKEAAIVLIEAPKDPSSFYTIDKTTWRYLCLNIVEAPIGCETSNL